MTYYSDLLEQAELAWVPYPQLFRNSPNLSEFASRFLDIARFHHVLYGKPVAPNAVGIHLVLYGKPVAPNAVGIHLEPHTFRTQLFLDVLRTDLRIRITDPAGHPPRYNEVRLDLRRQALGRTSRDSGVSLCSVLSALLDSHSIDSRPAVFNKVFSALYGEP